MLYNDPVEKSIMVAKAGGSSSPFHSSLFMLDDPACLAPAEHSLLSTPHSAAFLDLDGDCMPDLFLTT